MVRDIRSFNGGLFEGMRAWLFPVWTHGTTSVAFWSSDTSFMMAILPPTLVP